MPAPRRFREIWIADTEFLAAPGERPHVHCLVAKEHHSGRIIKLWRDDLLKLKAAPFDIGPDALFVAYFASAELGCFLQLGWPLPLNTLDLFTEHRAATNGLRLPYGNGLLGAMALCGLPAPIETERKRQMQQKAMRAGEWSAAEVAEMLDYCEGDVVATDQLYTSMEPAIDWPRALFRGRYMGAVAHMERVGVPIDVPTLARIRADWERIKPELIETVDKGFSVYEGTTFKESRFEALVTQLGIPWPRFSTGHLMLDDDTFKEQAKAFPVINPLRELRGISGKLRVTGLTVGADGFNRCLLSPFSSRTGRNQPSNAKFIFGPSVCLRSLIKPPEGYGLAYIDWSAQEFAIAAALSGDERMIADYLSGDPHLAFAKTAGMAPPDATKATHGAVRDQCKTVNLGVLYGMQAEGIAARLDVPACEARTLLFLHREAYRTFWQWMERVVATTFLDNRLSTEFGWRLHITADTRPTAAMNFPMQANGAEMMRAAAIAAAGSGVAICAPVHDAFLILAPLDSLETDAARMQAIMTGAAMVTCGVEIRTDVSYTRYPDTYADERGAKVWTTITRLISTSMPDIVGRNPLNSLPRHVPRLGLETVV